MPKPVAKSAQSLSAKRRDLAPAIFTIGHSTHPWPEFRDLLLAHGVQRVVDVRTIPRSRHNPQYNKDTLAAELKRAKIAYTHIALLGGLRRAHPDSINTGWHNASFRGYADYMQTPEFEKGLDRLIRLSHHKTCSIMCAEAVPWRCHRSMIADALVVRKIPVFHIATKNSAPPHSLTPFAKVRAHKITYPADSKS
jgi:uncharacterized protein (DUF488 family)